MSNVTLIMTRTPLMEVNQGKRNGRWGMLLVVRGGRVRSGRFAGYTAMPPFASFMATAGLMFSGEKVKEVPLGNRVVALDTDGDGVQVLNVFDTLERFRTDKNKSKYYVQLKPRPEKPYEIRTEKNGKVHDTFKKDGLSDNNGECFRVYGHSVKNGNGGRAGILIHEAPHVGYLLGCIGPREVNNRKPGFNRQVTKKAMRYLFEAVCGGGFATGKKAQLLVMDW